MNRRRRRLVSVGCIDVSYSADPRSPVLDKGLSNPLLLYDATGDLESRAASDLQAASYQLMSVRDISGLEGCIKRVVPIAVLINLDKEEDDFLIQVKNVFRANKLGKIPCLFLHDPDKRDQVRQLYKMGFDHILDRSIENEALISRIETLVERYREDLLQVSSQRVQVGQMFKGLLDQVSVPELGQLLTLGQKTGTVTCTAASHQGTLYFLEGKLHAADYKDNDSGTSVEGNDAALAIMQMREGSFEIEFDVPILNNNVSLSYEMVVMEAMRAQDEHDRDLQKDKISSGPADEFKTISRKFRNFSGKKRGKVRKKKKASEPDAATGPKMESGFHKMSTGFDIMSPDDESSLQEVPSEVMREMEGLDVRLASDVVAPPTEESAGLPTVVTRDVNKDFDRDHDASPAPESYPVPYERTSHDEFEADHKATNQPAAREAKAEEAPEEQASTPPPEQSEDFDLDALGLGPSQPDEAKGKQEAETELLEAVPDLGLDNETDAEASKAGSEPPKSETGDFSDILGSLNLNDSSDEDQQVGSATIKEEAPQAAEPEKAQETESAGDNDFLAGLDLDLDDDDEGATVDQVLDEEESKNSSEPELADPISEDDRTLDASARSSKVLSLLNDGEENQLVMRMPADHVEESGGNDEIKRADEDDHDSSLNDWGTEDLAQAPITIMDDGDSDPESQPEPVEAPLDTPQASKPKPVFDERYFNKEWYVAGHGALASRQGRALSMANMEAFVKNGSLHPNLPVFKVGHPVERAVDYPELRAIFERERSLADRIDEVLPVSSATKNHLLELARQLNMTVQKDTGDGGQQREWFLPLTETFLPHARSPQRLSQLENLITQHIVEPKTLIRKGEMLVGYAGGFPELEKVFTEVDAAFNRQEWATKPISKFEISRQKFSDAITEMVPEKSSAAPKKKRREAWAMPAFMVYTFAALALGLIAGLVSVGTYVAEIAYIGPATRAAGSVFSAMAIISFLFNFGNAIVTTLVCALLHVWRRSNPFSIIEAMVAGLLVFALMGQVWTAAFMTTTVQSLLGLVIGGAVFGIESRFELFNRVGLSRYFGKQDQLFAVVLLALVGGHVGLVTLDYPLPFLDTKPPAPAEPVRPGPWGRYIVRNLNGGYYNEPGAPAISRYRFSGTVENRNPEFPTRWALEVSFYDENRITIKRYAILNGVTFELPAEREFEQGLKVLSPSSWREVEQRGALLRDFERNFVVYEPRPPANIAGYQLTPKRNLEWPINDGLE